MIDKEQIIISFQIYKQYFVNFVIDIPTKSL